MTETAYFRADTFRVTLYLPRLNELPVSNIRKLFRLVFLYDWENDEAIQTLGLYIQNAIEDSRQAWDAASVRYQQERRLIEKPTTVRRTRKDIEKAAAIRAHNDALTRAVKKAKGTHEQWVKINTIFHEYRP